MLTSFQWSGAPVETPVRLAFTGGRAYLKLRASSPLLERIWNDPHVRVASGRADRPAAPIDARARVLSAGEESEAVRAATGTVGRLLHRLSRRLVDPLYVEITAS